MIDDRTQQQVRHRLLWAQEDIKAIRKKSLELMSMFGSLDERQYALWVEVTLHIANADSHVHNALQRVPEIKRAEE